MRIFLAITGEKMHFSGKNHHLGQYTLQAYYTIILTVKLFYFSNNFFNITFQGDISHPYEKCPNRQRAKYLAKPTF